MRSFNAIIIALTLSLGACSFKKDDVKNDTTPKEGSPSDVVETIQKEQEKQAFEGQLNELNVQVTFNELPEPKMYQMTVVWPEQIKRMQVIVNGKTPAIYTSASPEKFYSETVLSGKAQNIELIAYDSLGAPISSLALTKIAPVDFVLDQNLYLDKDTLIEANRFFINSGFAITTNGNNFSIITKKLIVKKDEETALAALNMHTS